MKNPTPPLLIFVRCAFMLFTITIFFSFQQNSKWEHLYSVKTTCDFFTTDYLGNLYTVKRDEIIKYNSTGEKIKMYSNKKLGKILYTYKNNIEVAYHSKISPKIIYKSKIYESQLDWINKCFKNNL